MEIFFSVVIPLFNKEKDIADTIQSVLDQSYRNFEIVVVNDGSTDKGFDIVKAIRDSRIKLFETENGGAAAARNYGVENSKGEYIAFLDADDYWYPHHLDNHRSLIEKFPEGKWYATAYEILHNKRLTLPMKSPIMDKGNNWQGEVINFFSSSMNDCLAWTSAVCMRKDFFIELNGFNLNYDTGQDVDLWIRAALSSALYYSNKISARYKLTASNRLTNKPTKLKRHMEVNSFVGIEKENLPLRRYLDLIRFSYAIKFKMAGLKDLYLKYRNTIDTEQLTRTQKMFLNTHGIILKFLVCVKNKIENAGSRIRVPRSG
ncbi:glycosyltransferase family 2 protein [Saccharicrinis sp. GN24d3]|uniref:glycosyltransferase family 2 protein n=1 Tax=Saccharicrinis sp. GN24d3 TaxID=3458416 RepID=UPI004036039B